MLPALGAAAIAKQLGKPSRSGKGWVACCPAHDDKKPSLLIYDRPGGDVYVECQVGCDFRDVRRELLERGLLPESERKHRPNVMQKERPRAPPAKREIVWPVPDGTPEPDWQALVGWVPTQVYRYLDAAGRLLHFVIRRDHPPSKDIRPVVLEGDAAGRAAWALRGPLEPRPLYGLDLLAARPDAPVLVVEGEKTAEAARRLFPDWVVVTWPGGASAVEKTDWSPLFGREVTAWPDHDDAGREAIARLGAILEKDLR